MDAKATYEMRWIDRGGRQQSRAVNLTLDIRDFQGRPGFALLVIAANPHLSIRETLTYLEAFGVKRSGSYITRRRWLFHDPAGSGAKTNRDGRDAAAIAIMATHPTMSLRDLSRLLAESGIVRGKDWIRQNRCRAVC
jgi:hypothetical protein